MKREWNGYRYWMSYSPYPNADIAYYRSLLKLAIDTRDEQLLKATYSNLKELSGVTINERIEYCQYFFPYMVFPLRCIRKIKTAIDT